MSYKRISLYVPCFNAQSYIQSCLDSVLKQSYPIEEILVIDDASCDKTVEIASRFPVKVIAHKENKGLAAVRNTAIKNAAGDFIASLDADCSLGKDWLKNIVKDFSSKVAGVGGRLLESDLDNPIDFWRAIHMRQEWGEAKSNSVSFLFGSNNIFRKDVLIKVGGYNVDYKNNYEDVDISKRIKAAGYSLIYESKAVAYHLKKDTICSLFDTFWNWNFAYHEKRGCYDDYKILYSKIKENIGLANRFMVDDLYQERVSILYFNFLLCFYLSLKDFLYMYSKNPSAAKDKKKNFYLSCLSLIDLTFFYHADTNEESLRTFISGPDSFFQNLFAFLFLNGRFIRDEFKNYIFLKTAFKHLIEGFIEIKNGFPEELLKKILLVFESHREWDNFLKKGHPNLNKQFLRIFSINIEDWFNSLTFQFPNIINLIKVSQYDLIAKEGAWEERLQDGYR